MSDFRDPVCGMTVSENSPHHARHEGTDYWFCSAGCREKFVAQPAQFLGEVEAPEPSEPVEAERWICPMDPGVESDRPGPCPICGMPLEPASGAPMDDGELRAMRNRFWFSAPLSLIVMFLAMHEMVGISIDLRPELNGWVQAGLTLPILVYGGWPVFARALLALRGGRANMFTLIALGVLSAYGMSLAALLVGERYPQTLLGPHGHPLFYFESAAIILSLVLLGQWLEQRARGQSASSLRGLLELIPASAFRIRGDAEEEVPVSEIQPGDHLRIKVGGKIPVDGRLLSGHGSVDESALRGEFLPVEKESGDPLYAGSVNGQSAVIMEAEQVGATTLLAQIVARVAAAQRSRAPIQSLADKVAAVFVPAVIVVALAAGALWILLPEEPSFERAIVAAVAVLVIACPCALGLATPISVMVGMGRGARAGVLFRDAEALQRLAEVDAIVLDKTGTLTEGRARIAALVSPEGSDEQDLIARIAGLERASGHPLAEAFLSAAGERGLRVPLAASVEVRPGRGVAGVVDGQRFAVGNEAMMADHQVDISLLEETAHGLRAEGKTVLFVARHAQVAALVAVEDPLRSESVEILDALRGLGLRVMLRSGDHEETVRAVAEQLKIEDWQANVLPEEKADTVAEMRMRGFVVAMVGDGINDAPALAGADSGIALASGSDIAMQSGSVILVDGDLRAILRARRLSQATLANIRQNLVFAFGYNLLAVPLAAGALYPWLGMMLSPMVAAAAMSFSSLSVIGNALRLRGLRL